ncbi:YfiR family protein [Shewanella gelidii]|uniref:YfiR family protein n=1 Tax=Shewanella gelidii TaxID=1642821 RepID=UPI001665BB29|nr:YfiR family protein [Shewanella gelidii]MCL1096660.1 YfiR family protein [Shewanella gelidii]
MRTLKRLFSGLLLTLLLLGESVAAVDKEYALKAGFLFNFARYGEWSPEPAASPAFSICSPDASFIEVAGKVLKGQKVSGAPIESIVVDLTAQSLESCSLLFITAATMPAWAGVDNKELYNVMVVGESEGFIEAGGQIRFFLSGGKIRFEVSPKKLKLSGISMSSRVLRLGRVLER